MAPKFFALVILAGFAGLLAFATLYKYFEVRIASRWPSVVGRVRSLAVVQRKVGRIGDEEKDVELRNFAEIVYEYEVRGLKYRASRVSVSEDLGNYRVGETLAKYPAGASVTVFYNPTKPSEAMLERGVPDGIFRFMFFLIAGLIACGLLLIFGIDRVTQWLKLALPLGNNASLAVTLGVMGLFALLMGGASSYQARRTRDWPSTSGVIEESGFENFRTYDDGVRRILKRAKVVYSYRVKGNKYRGERLKANGWKTSGSATWLLRDPAKKYPPGMPVEVFYDPANPAEAVLERRVTGAGFIYLIGGALLIASAKAAGLF